MGFLQNTTVSVSHALAEAIADSLNPIIKDSDHTSYFKAFTFKKTPIVAKLLGFARRIFV
jgi:hypothetical protein